MQEIPYHNVLPPQSTSSDTVEHSRPTNSLEDAIIHAIPKAEYAPSWFKHAFQKIADAWFDPKSFESQQVYEALGVRTIKKYIPAGGDIVLRLLRKTTILKGGLVERDLNSLKNMEHFTRLYEGIHVALFSISSAFIGAELAAGNISKAAGLSALNTAINVFPSMLQR
jgi:hypothetical protein